MAKTLQYPPIPKEDLERAVALRIAGKPWPEVEKSLRRKVGAIRANLKRAGMQYEFPSAPRVRTKPTPERAAQWDTTKAGAMLKVSLRAGA